MMCWRSLLKRGSCALSKLGRLKRWQGDADICSHYGSTSLHLAAQGGNLNCVSLLVNFGCNLWQLDNDHRTALDIAALHERMDTVCYLDEQLAAQTRDAPAKVVKLKQRALVAADERVKEFSKRQTRAAAQLERHLLRQHRPTTTFSITNNIAARRRARAASQPPVTLQSAAASATTLTSITAKRRLPLPMSRAFALSAQSHPPQNDGNYCVGGGGGGGCSSGYAAALHTQLEALRLQYDSNATNREAVRDKNSKQQHQPIITAAFTTSIDVVENDYESIKTANSPEVRTNRCLPPAVKLENADRGRTVLSLGNNSVTASGFLLAQNIRRRPPTSRNIDGNDGERLPWQKRRSTMTNAATTAVAIRDYAGDSPVKKPCYYRSDADSGFDGGSSNTDIEKNLSSSCTTQNSSTVTAGESVNRYHPLPAFSTHVATAPDSNELKKITAYCQNTSSSSSNNSCSHLYDLSISAAAEDVGDLDDFDDAQNITCASTSSANTVAAAEEAAMESMRMFLRAHNLTSYIGLFEREKLDLETLLELNERDLWQLGLPLGHRKKLMNVLKISNKREKSVLDVNLC